MQDILHDRLYWLCQLYQLTEAYVAKTTCIILTPLSPSASYMKISSKTTTSDPGVCVAMSLCYCTIFVTLGDYYTIAYSVKMAQSLRLILAPLFTVLDS